MEMIDRYVYAVTERLPENTREDVAKELRANIEDMLPDDATEQDVREVLEKLGNPAILSKEYRQVKRYLIGPSVYDSYVSVLKLVIGIAAIVFTFLGLLGAVSEPSTGKELSAYIGDLITGALSAAVEGAVQAFLWVTVVFAIIERTGATEGNLPFQKRKWTVEELQPVSAQAAGKISRAEVIVGLVFLILFTAIFLFRPELFGWYESGSDGLKLIAPLFDIVRLQAYIPFMVILAVYQFGLYLYKFLSRRWTLPLAIANTVNNLALSILVYLMLNDRTLFSTDFFSNVSSLFQMSLSQVESNFAKGASVFIVIFIILSGIDSITGFVKCRKLPKITLPKE